MALLLKYFVFRAGASIVPRLPLPVAFAAASWAGALACALLPGKRHDVSDNLRHVLGADADPATVGVEVRRVFQSVAKYYVDLLASTRFNVEALRRRGVRAEGLEHLHAELDAGRGVILASAHYGCPEIPLQAARAWGLRFLVLAEPLEPPQLSDLFVGLRAAHGHRTLTVSYASLKEAMRTLRRGGIVLLLVDRDIQGRGVSVPYFGVETTMPTGAVELARATGASLVPVLSRRLRDGGAVVTLQPALRLERTGDRQADAQANVAALLQRFEAQIRADPGQWLVLQSLWSRRLRHRA